MFEVPLKSCLRPLQDLIQMMPHVDDVIANNEFQIEILAVRSVPHVRQCFRIDMANYCCQLDVVHLPKGDNFGPGPVLIPLHAYPFIDRKSTRLNSSHDQISYAVFCLKKKKKN